MRLGLAISPVLLLLAMAAIASMSPAVGVAEPDPGAEPADGPTTVVRDWEITEDTHLANGTWVLYDSIRLTRARLTVEDAVLVFTRDDDWTFYFHTDMNSTVSMDRVTVLFNRSMTILTSNCDFNLTDCSLRPGTGAPRETLLWNNDFGSMTLENCTMERTAFYVSAHARFVSCSFNASMVWSMPYDSIGTTFPYSLLVEGCTFTNCSMALIMDGPLGSQVRVSVHVMNSTFRWCPTALRVRGFHQGGSVLLEGLVISESELGLEYIDSGSTVTARDIQVEAVTGLLIDTEMWMDVAFDNTTLSTRELGVRVRGVYDQEVSIGGLDIVSEWDGVNASDAPVWVEDFSVEADRYDFVSCNATISIRRTTHGSSGLLAFGRGSIVHNRTVNITGTRWLDGPTIDAAPLRIHGPGGHHIGEYAASEPGPTNVTYWFLNATVDALSPTASAVWFKDGAFFSSIPFNVTDGGTVLVEIVDDQGPRISIRSPTNDSVVAGWTLELRGIFDERGSGMAEVRARDGDGPWHSGEWDVRGRFNITLHVTWEGYHTIEVNMVDRAGTAGSAFLYRVLTDATPPFIQVLSPGHYSTTTPVLLRGRTEQGASVSINSVPVEVDKSGAFDLLLDLPEGLASLLIEAVDPAGNTNSTTHSLEVDLTPPLFSIDHPKDGDWIAQDPMLVWGSAEDGATVLVNGEEALRNGPSFNWSVSLDEGPRTVRVLVRDRAGNEAEVVIGVTVDLTPPELVIDEPEEEETMTPLTSITLSGVVLDAFPVRVFANGVEATVSEGQWTVVVDLSPGYQVIDVKAEDEAGHQTFGSRTVFSDPVPPTMTLVLVLGDEVHTDTSGTFRTREVKATLRVSLDETARILVADRGTWEGSKGMNIIELDLAADAVNRLRVDAIDPAGNLAGEVELVVVVDITPPPLSISTPVVTGEGRNRVVEFAGTTEPGANLTVNGKGFPVGTDGAFAIIVSVVEGDNPFEFVATDQVGNFANETVVVEYRRPDEPVSDPVSWGAYVLVATVVAAVVVVALLYTRRRP